MMSLVFVGVEYVRLVVVVIVVRTMATLQWYPPVVHCQCSKATFLRGIFDFFDPSGCPSGVLSQVLAVLRPFDVLGIDVSVSLVMF
jgi:hypothetical protein